MDVRNVKDIHSAERKPDSLVAKPSSASSIPRQRDVSTLVSSSTTPDKIEPVQVHVHYQRPERATELRSRANDVIAVINVASEAADELGKLAKSIDGIVEQAASAPDSPQRIDILEQEANQLVDELRRHISTAAQSGAVDLTDSDERLAVEEKLENALRALFPDEEKEPFGLGPIQLSPVENIINVRASVAAARGRIESLRDSMENAKREVESAVLALDVAAQNSEASQVSIRDVDHALKVAGDMSVKIGADPANAMESVGTIGQQAFNLLRS